MAPENSDGLQGEHVVGPTTAKRPIVSWWRDSANVAAIAALLGAAMAAGAWINSCSALDFEREKHLTGLRLEFLDRALDSGRDPAYRAAVLRLLVVTLDKHDPLREWALEESAVLKELEGLRSQVQIQGQELARLRSTAQTTQYRKQASRVIETFAKLLTTEREYGVPSRVTTTTLTLSEHRSIGGEPLVLGSGEGTLLNLELPEGTSGQRYLLRLLEAEGGELWQGEVEVGALGSVALAVPPGFLAAGNYVIEIFAPTSPAKKLANYRFRVEHAQSESVQPPA